MSRGCAARIVGLPTSSTSRCCRAVESPSYWGYCSFVVLVRTGVLRWIVCLELDSAQSDASLGRSCGKPHNYEYMYSYNQYNCISKNDNY